MITAIHEITMIHVPNFLLNIHNRVSIEILGSYLYLQISNLPDMVELKMDGHFNINNGATLLLKTIINYIF